VQTVGLDALVVAKDALQHPFGSFAAFFNFIIFYPLAIFSRILPDIFSSPFRDQFVIHGPLAALPVPVFFAIAGVLYWTVWINVTLATFNALPMGPLDGGQMFRATLRERLFRRYNVDRAKVHVERAELGGLKLSGRDEETQQKLDRIQHVVKRTTWTLGFTILGLILIPIVVPHVLQLFY
jgi:membrane-associated protease RseP (regulator of RpoE activity)